MASAFIRWALRHSGVVLGLALAALVAGLFVLARARYDVFPEFVPPQATVQTEAPGMTPEQVELLVTKPLEDAIHGATGIESVRSESIQGLSVITVTFAEGSDPYRARQVVAERLGEVGDRLPSSVATPKLTPLVSSTMDLLKLGFRSGALSPLELRDLVQWTVRPRLLAVPGVARATLFGGEVRQIQVQVDPHVLARRDISLDQVLEATRAASGVRGGGFVETASQRVLIETHGQTLTPEALAEAIVVAGAAPVRLGDVSAVAWGAEPKFGDTLVAGQPGVLLTLSSQYGANTLEVTRATERALEELEPLLAERGVTTVTTHRPAHFIETALGGVRDDLALGTLFIAVVLFLFLRDPRSVLVSFVTIPLALLAAVAVVDAFGWTINTMTLGGLAVALGVVVDDAIIDVENIVRRLRSAPGAEPGADAESEAASAPPRSRAEVTEIVYQAAMEVRAPVVYATFVVAIVLVPVLLLSGLQGSFFAPLAATFIVATLASLLVALTVTPALALLALGRARLHDEPRAIRRIKEMHSRWLERACAHPLPILLAAGALVALSAAALPYFGAELIPEFREGHFVIQVVAPPGESLPAMLATGARISKEIDAIHGVRVESEQIGRAEAGEDTWPPSRSEFHVELDELSGREEIRVQREIQGVLAGFPGLQTEVMTFLGDRISESLSGEASPVAVGVYGDDLDTLDRVASSVAGALRRVPGSGSVQVKSPPGLPLVSIDLDAAALARFGFRTGDLLAAIENAYQGTVVSQVHEGNRAVDIAVVLPPELRADPEAIGALLVETPAGVRMPLSALAEVTLSEGRANVMHDGGRRRQVVTAHPTTRDVGGFVAKARAELARSVRLPPGVYLEFAGAAASEAAARRELLLHSAIAALGVVLLLALAFGDGRSVALIVGTGPFALVGGVAAVALTGGTLSIGSLVGFVTLFGIAARNAILLVAHVGQLVQDEGEPWSLATLLRATRERLVPIVMTATVTALGLLPLAWGTGEAGREVQGPMAQVILGGLVTSTVLNLLVVPVLIWRFWRPSALSQPANAALRGSEQRF